MKKLLILLLFTLFSTILFSQYTVRENDIHFQTTLVRSIDLVENSNLFGPDNTLVRVLLKGFEEGRINGFNQDKLQEEISWKDFEDKISYRMEDDSIYYEDVKRLHVIELHEHLIVDKHRSDIVFNPSHITIFLPYGKNHRGLHEALVSFKYEDCVKIFKSHPDAYARNPLFNGRNLNFTEVFLLHLYKANIVKIGNPEDPYFDQITFSSQHAFLLGKQQENQLTEYLYTLFNAK